VWSGRSCPLPLTLVLHLILNIKINIKIKSGGQECPPYTNKAVILFLLQGAFIHV
jgi:hypothetical protein